MKMQTVALLVVLVLGACLLIQCTRRRTWYTLNSRSRSIETPLLRVQYVNMSGILGDGMELTHQQTGERLGLALDMYGHGPAQYDRKGPDTYVLKTATDDYVDIQATFHGGVEVQKVDRVYRRHPILEIRYEKLNVLWFEDFWDNQHQPTVLSFYGIPFEIDRQKYEEYLTFSQETAGHMYFDVWLKGATGCNMKDVTYKGYLIFGTQSTQTQRGIGEVYPVELGVHHLKHWWAGETGKVVPNYECFPAKRQNVRRWIFIYEGGRAGMVRMGKFIVDQLANKE